jgi:dolichol-phosphate mannosyltransferase
MVGVGVNLAILRLLFGELHWAAPLASGLAVEISIANNFLWNNWWTFGERTISWIRFVRYNLASLGGLAITAGLFTLLMGRFGLPYIVADLIGIGAATAWNFGASVRWTWARQ